MMMQPNAVETDTRAVCDLWYRIDRNDRIVAYGGPWRCTPVEDVAGAVPTSGVIGTRIYDHVSGHFTRRFLRQFFEQARRQTATVRRKTYRCDGPGQKVLVEMTAHADENGGIVTTHRDVEVAALPFHIAVLNVRSRRLASALRCSMCNRLKNLQGGEWLEPEKVARPDVVTSVVHTVCSDCRQGIAARISR
jgi:hypothetical protein